MQPVAHSLSPQKRDIFSSERFNTEDPAEHKRIYETCPIAQHTLRWPLKAEQDPTQTPAYLGGRDIQFYVLDDTKTNSVKTGVMHIATFAPEPEGSDPQDIEPCIDRFILDTVLGVRNLTAAGVTNLVIDTTNNGGGYADLSALVQRALGGSEYAQQVNFEQVSTKDPLTQDALEAMLATNDEEILGYEDGCE